MKTKHVLLAMAALGLTLAGACKKKTTETPKPTGVILCKVNGVSWESGASTRLINIDGSNYYMTYAELQGDTFTMSGIRKDGDTSGIYFYEVALKAGAVGTVSGTTDAFRGGMYLNTYDMDGLITALGKYNITYQLTITKKDASAKTISGSFIINMTSGSGNISITEGEFIDLKYK
jgi:hypothetical protein